MNQYKLEMKQVFKKEIMVSAVNEAEAMRIAEQTFLRTNLLDSSYADLEAVETKVVAKNEHDNYENIVDEENIIDEESRENIEETIEDMKENIEKVEEALDDDDIVLIDMLIEDLEENLEEMKKIVHEIE